MRGYKQTVLVNQETVVKKVKREPIQDDNHLRVKMRRFERIDQNQSVIVDSYQHETVGKNYALEATATSASPPEPRRSARRWTR